MTQPEPTRDPRLLSDEERDDLASVHARLGEIRSSIATQEPYYMERLIEHIWGTEAHIAAQDQRHAALVEVLKFPDGEGWWWYTPTYAQRAAPVYATWWPTSERAWVSGYCRWSDELPGLWQRIVPFAALAQPPGDE